MSFVPDDELKERSGVALAPMIDFLFIVLALFATLAFTRIVLSNTEIELVKSKAHPPSSLTSMQGIKLINISVEGDGSYKWFTEIKDYPMESAEQIANELARQIAQGILPQEKIRTQVLLKIDKRACWEPILKVILAIQESGFEVRPVYEPTNHSDNSKVDKGSGE